MSSGAHKRPASVTRHVDGCAQTSAGCVSHTVASAQCEKQTRQLDEHGRRASKHCMGISPAFVTGQGTRVSQMALTVAGPAREPNVVGVADAVRNLARACAAAGVRGAGLRVAGHGSGGAEVARGAAVLRGRAGARRAPGAGRAGALAAQACTQSQEQDPSSVAGSSQHRPSQAQKEDGYSPTDQQDSTNQDELVEPPRL